MNRIAPTNLATDKDGNVYVSDTGDFSVKVFDPNGKYIRTVGQMGIEAGRFSMEAKPLWPWTRTSA